MIPELKLVATADGSNTIFNPQVGEHYHSRHGALQESRHVFINAGLQYFLQQAQGNRASILEVGFGTGLNFLLSADYCRDNNIQLNYTGVEAYPLSPEMIGQTGYEQYVLTPVWDAFIENYPTALKQPTLIDPYCALQIAHCKLMDFQCDKTFDIIYFDAFAAIHQPEMWNEDAIAHTIRFLNPDGVFVTYAITGNLKRMLKGLGMDIQKIPGAPGKREMLRAVKCVVDA